MYDTTSTLFPCGTAMENLPSVSVVVPFPPSFDTTLAPARGSPSFVVTVPEMVRSFCAEAVKENK
jgi:hypothetical protein